MLQVATLSRDDIASLMLHSSSFAPFLKAAPLANTLLTEFHGGDYAAVVKALTQLQVRHPLESSWSAAGSATATESNWV